MRNSVFPPVRGGVRSPMSRLSRGSVLPAGVSALFASAPLSSGILRDTRPGLGTRRSLILPSQQPGRAYDFDGLDDEVRTAYTTAMTTVSGSAWVKWEAGTTSNYCHFLSKGNVFAAGAFEFAAYVRPHPTLTSQSYGVFFDDGTTLQSVAVTAQIPWLSEWVHIAFTIENGSQKLYLNGVQVATQTGTIGAGSAFPITLGCPNALDSTSHRWNGKIWDARVFNSVLTADQVRELYVNGVTALADVNHVVRFKCEDQHPTLALDSSGNGRHGTKSGHDATVGQFHYQGSNLPRQTGENEQGFSSRAFFNGTSSMVELGTLTGAGMYSFKCKFCPSATVNYTSSAQYLLSTSGAEEFIALGSSTGVAVNELIAIGNREGSNSKRRYWQNTVGSLVAGTVYEIEWRWDGATYQLYVDGVLIPTIDGSSGGITTQLSLANVIIGSTQVNTSNAVGLIYDIEIKSDANTVAFSTTGTTIDKVDWNNGTLTNISLANIPAATASTDALGGTLTYTGKSPIDAKLKQSWCAHGDGSDDHIDFGDLASLDVLTNHVTWHIEAESDVASVAGDDTLFAKYDAGIPAREWLASFNFEEKLLFYIGGANIVKTDSAITLADPHSYTITFSSGTLKIYVDGVEVPWSMVSGAIPSAITPTAAKLGIMNYFNSGSPTGNVWDGKVWNFQIWKGESRALNATEVLELHRSKSIAPPTGQTLVFHAPLAEGGGSPVTFDTVSGAAGTITGADTTVGGTFWARQDNYHYNAVEGYDLLPRFKASSSQYVVWDTGSTAVDQFGACTISFYASIDDTSGIYIFTALGSSAYRIYTQVGGIINFNLGFNTGVALTAGRLYFVEVDFDATGAAKVLRVDGVQRWSGTAAAPSPSPDTVFTAGVRFSSGTPAYYLNGQLRQVKVSGVLEWNENWVDISGNGRHGEVKNGPLTKNYLPFALSGTLSNPGSVLHNGAESGIDWTGGVAFPQPALPVNILNDGPADFTKWPTVATSWAATSQEVQGLPVYNLISTAAATPQYAAWNTLNITSGQKYSFSVLLKDAGARYAQIGSAVFGGLVRVNIDLETGTIGSNDFFTEYASLTDVGNGWYLFEGVDTATITASNGTITLGFAGGPTSGRITPFTGDGSVGILCAGFMVESGVKRRQVYNPAGIINTLDTDWYFPDTPANPHAQRHVSDGYGNILKIDRRVHYDRAMLGTDLEALRNYTADPQGLLADNFNRADQSTPGLDWVGPSGLTTISGDALNLPVATNLTSGYLRPLKTANHEAEAVISVGLGPNSYLGLIVRLDEAGLSGLYVAFQPNSTINSVSAYILPSGTLIGTTTSGLTIVNGDRVKVRVSGNTMTSYVNDVLVRTDNISAYTAVASNKHVGLRWGPKVGSKMDNFKARDI